MNDRSAVPAAPPVDAPAAPRPGNSRAGILSGLAGGLAMLALLSLVAGGTGLGWLHPLETIGVTTAGLQGGAAAAAVGLLLHALASAALGLAFAALLPEGFPPISAVGVGGGYGLLVAGLMMSLAVPAVSPELRGAIQPVGGSWVVGNVLFGCTLAATLVLLRRARG